MKKVSIVVPAYNEADAITDTVHRVQSVFQLALMDVEVVVVDDGSRDDTAARAERAGARVIRHPTNIGYGNALLSGIRAAQHSIVGITDADGTYPIEELPNMVTDLEARQLDMLVGARTGEVFLGSFPKRVARYCLKAMAEFACGRTIPDINSGLRVMRRDIVLRFSDMLCGGFSFTTTITIISFLTHHFVDYRPIAYRTRIGKSHVRYGRDILRTSQLLAMTIINFNPIKFFMLFGVSLLPLGFAVSLLCWLVPSLAIPVAVGSLFFLTSCILMALGFHCTREATQGFRAVFPRETTAPRATIVETLEKGSSPLVWT